MARIFLSYGHDDSVDIARLLKLRLEERGHRVWLDESDLSNRVSSVWEREIERQILDSDVFLALLSPRSVHPDSFCRNELAHAHDARKRIVPVMVRRCELPLRINTLQYLDLDGWQSRHGLVDSLMETLVQAVEHGVPEDPHLADLRRQFPALDFSEDFARHRRFAGRAGLFAQIDEWAESPDSSPVLFIVGPPAIGKSALIANWVSQRLRVGAVHFCRYDRASTVRVEDFTRSVVAQILQLGLDEYAEMLRSVDLSRFDPRSDEFFVKTVTNPLRALPSDRIWTLAVDALDEAEPALVDMLGRIWRDLPSNLRLLITSRRGRRIEEKFPKPIVLDAASDENRRDLAAHVQAELSMGRLRSRLEAAGADANRIGEEIETRAEGTFLVACEILRALSDGDLVFDRLDAWPQGLGGLHRQHLERQFPHAEDFETVRLPLSVHVAALESVSDADVAAVCSLPVRKVQTAMDRLGSLFPEGADGRRAAWHKSFFDWLTSLRASDDFSVDIEDAHVRWAEWCASNLAKAYPLRYAVEHRLEVENQFAARELLCSWSFLRARVKADLVWVTIEELLRLGEGNVGFDLIRAIEVVFRTKASELAYDPDSFDSILATSLPIEAIQQIPGEIDFEDATLVRLNRSAPRAEVMRLIHPPFDHVSCVVYSHNGRWIGTSTLDGVHVWDAKTGQYLHGLYGFERPMNGFAWSPDDKRIVGSSLDPEVRVWDVSTEECIAVLNHHTGLVRVALYSPDGRYIASGSSDKSVCLWDASTFALLHTVVVDSHVTELSFSPDSKQLAALSLSALYVWDADSFEEQAPLRRYSSFFDNRMKFLSANRILLTGGTEYKGKREIFTLENGELKHLLSSPEGVNAWAASRDEHRLALADGHGVVSIWNLDTGENLGNYVAGCGADRGLDFAPDGKTFATESYQDEVRVWDLSKGGSKGSREHYGVIESLEISPDGKYLACTTQSSLVGIWKTDNASRYKGIEMPDRKTWCANFSLDSRMIATGHYDGKFHLTDIESGELIREFSTSEKAIYRVIFHPSQSLVASSSTAPSIRLWRYDTGEQIRTFEGHEGEVVSIAFTPDGKMLISGSFDQTVRIWGLHSGECLAVIEGFEDSVDKISLSPDGRYAVVGGWRPTFEVIDLEKGTVVRQFKGHEERANTVVFSPDGSAILSAAWDRTIRLWDVESGHELYRFHTDDANLHAVFDPHDELKIYAAVGHEIWILQLFDAGPFDRSVFDPFKNP